MNAFEQRDRNTIRALAWINQFGWLRTAELGRLLWPGDIAARRRADRLIQGLLDRRLVLDRKLPDGGGRAFVLSGQGARQLTLEGIDAHTGKSIGETAQGLWRAPANWRHDLMTAGVLSHLFEAGYSISPERELLRNNFGLTKIPDGLAWKIGTVAWLETEGARKTGNPMRNLADAICVISDGTCRLVSGRQPNQVMIAYRAEALDERAYRVDHRARVSRAVSLQARRDVAIVWVECKMKGYGVHSIQMTPAVIPADRVSQVLQRLDNNGWYVRNDCLESSYGDAIAQVWEDTVMGWSASINDGNAVQADTKALAQRACASLIIDSA